MTHIKQLNSFLKFGIARAYLSSVQYKTNKKEQSSDNNKNSAG
jgi:hypothetical protein